MEIAILKAGDEVVEAVVDSYHAGIPVLLMGKHGIGKSDLLAQAAEYMEVGFIVRDLSIMQPIDLVGVPIVTKGVTRFARPAFLPKKGSGLIAFEELNRCPEYMRAPCLQLLTARTLNDYRVPDGWMFAACINPPGTDYEVEELCPALKSRFKQIHVVPDAEAWTQWAKGRIHSKVVEFVELCPRVFEDADANPRAWTNAGKLLARYEKRSATPKEVRKGLTGVIGETWAIPFQEFYEKGRMPLAAMQIVEEYKALRQTMKEWLSKSRLDMVDASLATLKSHLRGEANYNEVLATKERVQNVRAFIADLPPDLRKEMRGWLRANDRHKITLTKEGPS